MRFSLPAVLTLLASCVAHLALAVRDMKFYNTLSVASDASEADIKKAYRKAAMCAASQCCSASSIDSHLLQPPQSMCRTLGCQCSTLHSKYGHMACPAA